MNTKIALQKLVDKLELIQKDEYYSRPLGAVFSQLKNELTDAKKALEESDRQVTVKYQQEKQIKTTADFTPSPYENISSNGIDLFDLNQLPLKDENEF